jgi:hypothetical protein
MTLEIHPFTAAQIQEGEALAARIADALDAASPVALRAAHAVLIDHSQIIPAGFHPAPCVHRFSSAI